MLEIDSGMNSYSHVTNCSQHTDVCTSVHSILHFNIIHDNYYAIITNFVKQK